MTYNGRNPYTASNNSSSGYADTNFNPNAHYQTAADSINQYNQTRDRSLSRPRRGASDASSPYSKVKISPETSKKNLKNHKNLI